MRKRDFALIAITALSAGCSGDKSGRKSEEAIPQDTAAMEMSAVFSKAQIENGGIGWELVAASDVSTAARVPGSLVPNEDRTARLGAPAEGRVVDVRVRPGDRVRSGQVLLTLNSPAAASAQSDVAKARAHVASEQAQAAYAASARARAERLLALKAIPRQDYERAVADDELARAAKADAEAELQRATSTARQFGAGSPGGQMLITAPISGIVLDRTAVPGTVLETGAPLVTVSQLGTLWLTASVPETYASYLRPSGVVSFDVPAYGNSVFTAKIDAIGAALNPQTRTIDIRAIVDNAQGKLRPGMLANVTVTERAPQPGTMVPADAVQRLMGKAVVFIVEPHADGGARFTAQEVSPGERDGTRVNIVSGLTAGARVVTRGAFIVKSQIEKAGMPKMEM